MKKTKMGLWRLAAVILGIGLAALGSVSAAIDKKFYNKVAEDVWKSSDKAVFNPQKTIPDSILQNNSAVIIAWADDIDVNHIVQPAIYLASGETNRIKKNKISHVMVKLLDPTAIEDYTEFEFGKEKEITIQSRVLAYQLKSAFGARIHKPDGTIVDVNLNDAIEVGDGKKGKDNKTYKIAIPGLEVGDVLEYFRYEDETAETINLDPENLMISQRYPVLNRRISITTVPTMTVEYKTYNGVPNFTRSVSDKGTPMATLRLENIPGVNFTRYVMPYSQLPFVRVQFLNNYKKHFLAANSRAGGLYGNIHAGKIISELGDYLHDLEYENPVGGKATKLVKDNFLKTHPDASPKEIADALWLAVMYSDMTAKKKSEGTGSQFERSLTFFDALRKLKVYPVEEMGIGIINPRSDVPTREISAWDESRFVVKTPDALYFMPKNTGLAPAELPGAYKGATAAYFSGDRKKLDKKTIIQEYTVPNQKVTENSAVFRDTVTIDDEDRILMKSGMTFIGGVKEINDEFSEVPEWAVEVEAFFGIPDSKRYVDKTFDQVDRRKELRVLVKKASDSYYGKEPDSVTVVNVIARGVRPDHPSMEINAELIFSELAERLGDNLSVNVGRLVGMPDRLTDNERNRLLDAMLTCKSQETHILTVRAPEGYAFDSESVNELARSFNDVVGQFVVAPKINDDGDLVLTTSIRFKVEDVPLSHWPNLMKLLDEASSFSDAAVILVKR